MNISKKFTYKHFTFYAYFNIVDKKLIVVIYINIYDGLENKTKLKAENGVFKEE
jgi:hypothetical protein